MATVVRVGLAEPSEDVEERVEQLKEELFVLGVHFFWARGMDRRTVEGEARKVFKELLRLRPQYGHMVWRELPASLRPDAEPDAEAA